VERHWAEEQLRAERKKNIRLGITERLDVTMARVRALHNQTRVQPLLADYNVRHARSWCSWVPGPVACRTYTPPPPQPTACPSAHHSTHLCPSLRSPLCALSLQCVFQHCPALVYTIPLRLAGQQQWQRQQWRQPPSQSGFPLLRRC